MDKSDRPELKERGLKLARRIYYWFRMENMEGIPVYFRSAPEPGSTVPLEVNPDPGVRNYLITLVDAHMVASPSWRAYVSDLLVKDKEGDKERDFSSEKSADGKTGEAEPPRAEYRFLPVAMESVAYNMPEGIRSLNFIRHIPRGAVPSDDFELLAKITEVLCRDLRHWLRKETLVGKKARSSSDPVQPPGKIKIFLSHAKADDTREAVAIKEYIQRETQCEAFFDETEIASGYDFADILNNAISGDSAGLIVLQGDNYADRPWCRKEIRDFLEPIEEPLARGASHEQYVVAPVVVVQTMKGRQMARTIPELGYSPSLRWQEGRADAARFVVTTLLREICFGLFYRVLARRVAQREHEAGGARVYLNRSPDPVMINRIIAHRRNRRTRGRKGGKLEFVHPGYGLSKMEHEGLITAFPGQKFRSFLGTTGLKNPDCPDLNGKIIALSAGNPGDLLARGLWEEHIQELLLRLLRPLLQANASILYGGGMPKTFRPERPWDEPVNFTAVFLQLLIGDRDAGKKHPDPPRLFVPVPCHERASITATTVAQWSDVCTFVHVTPDDSGITQVELDASAPVEPDKESRKYLTDAEKREQDEKFVRDAATFVESQSAVKARSYSAMRRKICNTQETLTCELPDRIHFDQPASNLRSIDTLAHILIGGKTKDFSGIMPGVFEEALYAFDAGKPVFLIAEYGGAAAVLAKWLLNPPETRPPELTTEYYASLKPEPEMPVYHKMLAGFAQVPANTPHLLTPAEAFDRLWTHMKSANDAGDIAGILNNGLNETENRELLETASSGEICWKVWKGISNLREKKTYTPTTQ